MTRINRILGITVVVILAAGMTTFTEAGLFGQKLDKVRKNASREFDKFNAEIQDMTVNIETRKAMPAGFVEGNMTSGQGFFETEIKRKGKKFRTDTYSREYEKSDFNIDGFIEIFDTDNTYFWIVSTHVKNTFTWMVRGYYTKPLSTQHLKLERWFEMAHMEADGVEITGMENVGDRKCHVIRIPTQTVDELELYQFSNIDNFVKFERKLRKSGLQVHSLEFTIGNESFELSLDEMKEEFANVESSDYPRIDKLLAFEKEPVFKPVNLLPDKGWSSSETPPTTGLWENMFGIITELWIDKDNLQLVKIKGRRPDQNSTIECSIVWSDFREIADFTEYPFKADLYIDGKIFTNSEVTSVKVNQDIPDELFANDIVYSDIEIELQKVNRDGLLVDIANQRLDFHIIRSIDEVRDAKYHPEELLKYIDLKDGDVVADVGAGMGYWTIKLADAVGTEGTVYAVDVVPEYLALTRMNIKNKNLNPYDNIEYHIDTLDDLGLPDESIDLAFLCDTHFHRFETLDEVNRKMVESIYRACKPGARLINLERKLKLTGYSVFSTGWAIMKPDTLELDLVKDLPVTMKVPPPAIGGSGSSALYPRKKAGPRSSRTSTRGRAGEETCIRELDDVKRATFENAGFKYSGSSNLVKMTHDIFMFQKPE